MSARKLDSDVRKQQIIEAAAAVFARKGFDGATMDDIVAESGLSKGGLYWHFKSKDDIITAILQEFFDQEMVGLEQMVTGEGAASDRLLQLARHMAAEMETQFALLPISLEFYAVAARQPAVRAFIQEYYAHYRTRLASLIQQGIDRGEFKSVSANDAAATLVATFEGMILLWAIYPEAIALQEQVTKAVQLLLNGLRQGI